MSQDPRPASALEGIRSVLAFHGLDEDELRWAGTQSGEYALTWTECVGEFERQEPDLMQLCAIGFVVVGPSWWIEPAFDPDTFHIDWVLRLYPTPTGARTFELDVRGRLVPERPRNTAPLSEQEVLDVLQSIDAGYRTIRQEHARSAPGMGNLYFHTDDGWEIVVFDDCGQWDYVDSVTAPDGRTVDFAEIRSRMPRVAAYVPLEETVRDLYGF